MLNGNVAIKKRRSLVNLSDVRSLEDYLKLLGSKAMKKAYSAQEIRNEKKFIESLLRLQGKFQTSY